MAGWDVPTRFATSRWVSPARTRASCSSRCTSSISYMISQYDILYHPSMHSLAKGKPAHRSRWRAGPCSLLPAPCCSWAWVELNYRPHAYQACALTRSEEHTSELQSRLQLVCRLLLEKKNI